MHVGYSHIVTEYTLSDNSGEHVKLTEVDHDKEILGSGIVSYIHLCIALRQ